MISLACDDTGVYVVDGALTQKFSIEQVDLKLKRHQGDLAFWMAYRNLLIEKKIMPCGHPQKAVVRADNGNSFCGLCADEG
jgi:hypothetical protein